MDDFMGDFEILRHQYILDKKHLEDSSEEFARKCFKVIKQYSILKQDCEFVDYVFKDWNIELTYLWKGKKFGIIFDYTEGDLDNIITRLKKGLYDTIYYTNKRS